MCRFTLYRGRPLALSALLTEPENSLIHQSFHSHEREEPLNGDGFGVCWYAKGKPEPALFRSVTPAWSNRNLRELAQVVESGCILAHVRAATQVLEVTESNCHPFKHKRWSFMHNGDLGGFRRLRRKLLESLSDEAFRVIHGSTDSEHLFALFVDELERRGEPAGAEALAGVLAGAVGRALRLVDSEAPGEPSYLNVVVSDGESAVACRYTTDDPGNADSLHLSRGRRYVCDGNVCRMVRPEEGRGAVIVSSEVLSEDPGWEPVPVNHMVLVQASLDAEVRPMAVA